MAYNGQRLGQKGQSREEEIDLEADLRHWTRTMLAKPYVSLNGHALCPFAADAWAKEKVLVLDVTGDMQGAMFMAKNGFWFIHQLMEKDVLILCDFEASTYAPDEMFGYADQLLEENNNGVWLIPFHPEAEGLSPARDYDVSEYEPLLERDYAMCFVQATSHLNKASYSLEARGYYENWDELDLADLEHRRRYGSGDG